MLIGSIYIPNISTSKSSIKQIHLGLFFQLNSTTWSFP